jgi:hypothetical protein
MVGSYVVAWEVRAERSAVAQPALVVPCGPRMNARALVSALQERVTKEVADLETKRAKRFAGACVRRSARPSGD